MAGINPGISVPICSGGQRADLDVKDVPSGSMAYSRNWVIDDGRFRTRNGTIALGSPITDIPLTIYQYDHSDGDKRTIIGAAKGWWYWDFSALDWADITDALDPLEGTIASSVVFRVFYKSGVSYLVGVNGHFDSPKKWDGTAETSYAPVGGTPSNARCMAVAANRMLLGNLSYGGLIHPSDVDVSALNDFEDGWGGATQLVSLTDTPGGITEMREFGNQNVVIYKSDSIFMATAQSASFPFSFQLVQAEIRGPLTGRVVVATPQDHYFLSPDLNVYKFNGYQATPLPPAVQKHIMKTADIDSLALATGYYRSQKQEVRFIYPEAGTGKYIGIRIRLTDGTVWPDTWENVQASAALETILQHSTIIRQLVLPISNYTDPIKNWRSFQEYAILGCRSGNIHQNTPAAPTDYGDPILAEFETGLQGQSDIRRYFQVQESEHFFANTPAPQDVTIYTGKSESGENPVYDSGKVISLGNTRPKVVGADRTMNSRMFSLKVKATVSQFIHWRGSQFNGISRGMR